MKRWVRIAATGTAIIMVWIMVTLFAKDVALLASFSASLSSLQRSQLMATAKQQQQQLAAAVGYNNQTSRHRHRHRPRNDTNASSLSDEKRKRNRKANLGVNASNATIAGDSQTVSLVPASTAAAEPEPEVEKVSSVESISPTVAQTANTERIQNESSHSSSSSHNHGNRQILSFAGHPLTLHSKAPPYSQTQCLSENFQTTAFQYRSCHFHNLCYNIRTAGFQLQYSPQHASVLNRTKKQGDGDYYYLSSKTQPMVLAPSSVLNLKKGRAQWEPQEMTPLESSSLSSSSSSYYALPDNVVWIPLFPFKECKSGGQALWDVLLPIYTLLDVFDLLHHNSGSSSSSSSKPIVLVTELRAPKINCEHVWKEYEDMMGFTMHPVQDMLVLEQQQQHDNHVATNISELPSQFICSRHAVGGMGYLMDHGPPLSPASISPKLRGILPAPHNIRRAPNLLGFRDHLLSNHNNARRRRGAMIKYDGQTADRIPAASRRVTFCVASPTSNSNDPAVLWNAMQAVQHHDSALQMQLLDLSNTTTIRAQVDLIQTTVVMVVMENTICNAALFLPKGATLIFYSTAGSRADLDLWSNYAALRVHFMTLAAAATERRDHHTQDMLVRLIHDELDGLQQDASQKKNRDDQHQSPSPTIPFANHTTVTLVQGRPPPTSRVNCIGDTGMDMAWLFRSCHYKNLCFDLETKTFVVFPSDRMQQLINDTTTNSKAGSGMLLSSIPNQLVINGGQMKNTLMRGNLGWRPEVRTPEQITSYYQLPADTVWISFHPHPNCNGGHLLWDCILPLFSLLDIFNLTDKKLLLTESGNQKDCQQEVMEVLNLSSRLRRNSELDIDGGPAARQSNIVCADNSANGMAWHTDHGLNGHGKLTADFYAPVNVRRGPELVRFRNFLMKRWNIEAATTQVITKKKRVVFSILSSRAPERRFDFAEQIAAVKERLPDVQVDGIAMWNYTWAQQAKIASESAVYVSIVGGGTSSAFFLPKGSSLILFTQNQHMLDWDLWNNYAHIRVHWLSTPHMHNDTDLLVDLIQDELESLESFQ